MKTESKPEKKDKKLKLKRTTVRELTEEEAGKVQGGVKTTVCAVPK